LSNSRSRLILGAVNLVIFAFLWRWVNENISIEKLLGQIASIPGEAVALTVAINFMTLVVYGWRMGVLLKKTPGVGFSIVNIGYSLNTIMPLRLGDVLKVYFGRRLLGVPATAVLAASVAEKIVDVLMLLLLGVVMSLFSTTLVNMQGSLLVVGTMLFILVLAIMLCRAYILRIYRWLPKKGYLRGLLIKFSKHSRNYPMARVFTLTAIIWTFNTLLTYVSFNRYLEDIKVSLSSAVAILLVVVLAMAVPSAPAGIGLFEAGIVAYLTVWLGVDNEIALSAAVVFHMAIVLPQIILTALWLLIQRIRSA
jgi:uncharacterized protein (TIRG00374 family)